MNPFEPDKIEQAFGKILAKNKMTALVFKQWLLWNKIWCLRDLKVPYLSAMIAEVYLSFLQKYQITNKVHQILRVFMVLQTCHLLIQFMKKEIENFGGVAEIQQRFFYSTLSRLVFQEKQFLHKAVELLYSMKPLPMRERHEESLKFLSILADINVKKLLTGIYRMKWNLKIN